MSMLFCTGAITNAAGNASPVDVIKATTVIQSAMTVTIDDETSPDEQRFVTIGVSVKLRVLMVVHTYRDEEEIRIISARKAKKKEQEIYEERIRL